MRIFHCDHCDLLVFFENIVCGKCGHKLAYLPDLKVVASLDPLGEFGEGQDAATQLWTSPLKATEGRSYRLCKNYPSHEVCNWAIPSNDPNPLCQSCRLTRIIPDLSIKGNEESWRRLETAKRRLIYSLLEHELPLRTRVQDPENGLTFQFMADTSSGHHILTGHDSGVITVNIAEADDVERERLRVAMHEPYRTLLGHFRHEIGHYYWDILIKDSPRLDAYRQAFGDERIDYDQALRDHYRLGPQPDWHENFVSEYAGVHPWEDWAETWAHYLHMTDTLETAGACGLSLKPARRDEPAMKPQPRKPIREQKFDEIIGNWFPLTYALNSLNRGMGMRDAYPFVLSPAAVDKLRFVHNTICEGEPNREEPDENEDKERSTQMHESAAAG